MSQVRESSGGPAPSPESSPKRRKVDGQAEETGLEEGGEDVEPRWDNSDWPRDSTKIEPEPHPEVGNIWVEQAKSDRSKCRCCGGEIDEGEVRVSVVYLLERWWGSKAIPGWHHVPCFNHAISFRNYLLVVPKKMCNTSLLSSKDQALLLPAIKSIPKAKEQRDAMEKVRQEVGRLPTNQLSLLLTHNGQEIPHELPNWILEAASRSETPCLAVGDSVTEGTKEDRKEMLNRLQEVIYFGPLKPCAVCKNGQLVFCEYGYNYNCWKGKLDDGHRCSEKQPSEPERGSLRVPEEVLRKAPWLQEYVGASGRIRVLGAYTEQASQAAASAGPTDDDAAPKSNDVFPDEAVESKAKMARLE